MLDIVKHYLREGLPYQEIVDELRVNYSISISLRTFKRYLKKAGLGRYKKFPQTFVNEIVQNVLQGPGSSLGYRLLRQRIIIETGFLIPHEQIQLSVSLLDPEGVTLRAQRRLNRRTYHAEMPNSRHHLDGYDKLKPYGFSIFATIGERSTNTTVYLDGYSRYVLQLCVMVSNKEPNQVGHAFLDGAIENEGLPTKTVSDFGTETGVIAGVMQTFVGPQSHTYTSSQRNQRIESWWSQLRKGLTTYIMNHFARLEYEGVVNFGDNYDKDLIRYSFMFAIQSELNIFRATWNQHSIRSQRYNDVPSGVPSDLHFNSANSGKIALPLDILENIRNGLNPRNTSRTGDYNKDRVLFNVCCEQGLNMNPKTLMDSTELFLKLKNIGRIF